MALPNPLPSFERQDGESPYCWPLGLLLRRRRSGEPRVISRCRPNGVRLLFATGPAGPAQAIGLIFPMTGSAASVVVRK